LRTRADAEVSRATPARAALQPARQRR
jgi:hypothetical protein